MPLPCSRRAYPGRQDRRSGRRAARARFRLAGASSWLKEMVGHDGDDPPHRVVLLGSPGGRPRHAEAGRCPRRRREGAPADPEEHGGVSREPRLLLVPSPGGAGPRPGVGEGAWVPHPGRGDHGPGGTHRGGPSRVDRELQEGRRAGRRRHQGGLCPAHAGGRRQGARRGDRRRRRIPAEEGRVPRPLAGHVEPPALGGERVHRDLPRPPRPGGIRQGTAEGPDRRPRGEGDGDGWRRPSRRTPRTGSSACSR